MFLGLAIVFEVCGTMLLKASNGFEKVGVGMALMQYGFIALILIGAIGLNLTTDMKA